MNGPVRILIAALGGEGGGVLASWIADAAIADGFIAQRTSVPGVAQRTGSTTYYIELAKTDGRRPVLALSPAPGLVDLFIASELLEAVRQTQAGYVTPDRTFVITPTHRVFTIHEKIAMGDGRADQQKLRATIERFARAAEIDDFAGLAQKAGCQLNAVLLGLAARSLPIAVEAYRNAIRADGRAVEANLRGFEAGFTYVRASRDPENARQPDIQPAPAALVQSIDGLPQEARAFAREGVARLIDFQDTAYAVSYLDRLARFAALPGAGGEFVRELARHLAVRMSSEDVIRVAQLKLREARLRRVEAEARARPGDMIEITEFLKPGPAEILSIFPARLARVLLAQVERRGWSSAAFPMKVRTTGLWGFLRLKLLASLRALRPGSLRAAQEREWIDRWLALVERSLAVDPAAALEVVATAQMVRGYGETWERGHANWRRIADDLIEPMLRLSPPPAHFADAILQARLAANADPEGVRLAAVLKSIPAGA
ncbi:MAG: indolepyruvate oxidoreductase subunit beta family protein [Beijerinckiaceae bacterium]